MMKQFILFLTVICIPGLTVNAQARANDLDLLRSGGSAPLSDAHYSRAGNDAKVMDVQQSSLFARYNPVSLLLKGTMYTYQHVISPQLSRSCPYEITCSNFSKQSIKEFGIVKGVFITADRILRCNRIGVLDVDPLDFDDRTGTISDSPKKYQ